MRFLADENFPAVAVRSLTNAGHDVVWVPEVSPSLSDRDVLALAIRETRILLTFDKNFGEIATTWDFRGDGGRVSGHRRGSGSTSCNEGLHGHRSPRRDGFSCCRD
jgi:hypothetical protein